MAASKKSIRITLYILLVVLGVFLHMLLSGADLGGLITDIFSHPTGIFSFLGFILSWIFNQLLSPNGIYLFGLAVALEFLVFPLMIRYKFIRFRTNFAMSLVAAIYVMFLGRVLAIVIGA